MLQPVDYWRQLPLMHLLVVVFVQTREEHGVVLRLAWKLGVAVAAVAVNVADELMGTEDSVQLLLMEAVAVELEVDAVVLVMDAVALLVDAVVPLLGAVALTVVAVVPLLGAVALMVDAVALLAVAQLVFVAVLLLVVDVELVAAVVVLVIFGQLQYVQLLEMASTPPANSLLRPRGALNIWHCLAVYYPFQTALCTRQQSGC